MLSKICLIAILLLLNPCLSDSITTNIVKRINLDAQSDQPNLTFDITFDPASSTSGSIYFIRENTNVVFKATLSNGTIISTAVGDLKDKVTSFTLNVSNLSTSKATYLDILIRTVPLSDVFYDKINTNTLRADESQNYLVVDSSMIKDKSTLQLLDNSTAANIAAFNLVDNSGVITSSSTSFTNAYAEGILETSNIPLLLAISRIDASKPASIKSLIKQNGLYTISYDENTPVSQIKVLSINPSKEITNIKLDFSNVVLDKKITLSLSSVTNLNAFAAIASKTDTVILPLDKPADSFDGTIKAFTSLSAETPIIYITISMTNISEEGISIDLSGLFANTFTRVSFSSPKTIEYTFVSPVDISIYYVKGSSDITFSTILNGEQPVSDVLINKKAVTSFKVTVESTSTSPFFDYAIYTNNSSKISKENTIINRMLKPAYTSDINYFLLDESLIQQSVDHLEVQVLSSGNTLSVFYVNADGTHSTSTNLKNNFAALTLNKGTIPSIIGLTRSSISATDSIKLLIKPSVLTIADNTYNFKIFSLKKVDSDLFDINVTYTGVNYLRIRLNKSVTSSFALVGNSSTVFPISGEDNAFTAKSNKLISGVTGNTDPIKVFVSLKVDNLSLDGVEIIIDKVGFISKTADAFRQNKIDLTQFSTYAVEIQKYKNLLSGSNTIYLYVPPQEKANLTVFITETNDFNKKHSQYKFSNQVVSSGLIRYELSDMIFEDFDKTVSLFINIYNENLTNDVFSGEIFISSNTYIYASLQNVNLDLRPNEEAYYLVSSNPQKYSKVLFGVEKGIKVYNSQSKATDISSLYDLFNKTEFSELPSLYDENFDALSVYKIKNTTNERKNTYFISDNALPKKNTIKEGEFKVFRFTSGESGSTNKISYSGTQNKVQARVLTEIPDSIKVEVNSVAISNNKFSIITLESDSFTVVVGKNEDKSVIINNISILFYAYEKRTTEELINNTEVTAQGSSSYLYSFTLDKAKSDLLNVYNLAVTGKVQNVKYYIYEEDLSNNLITLPVNFAADQQVLINNLSFTFLSDLSCSKGDLKVTLYIQPSNQADQLKILIKNTLSFSKFEKIDIYNNQNLFYVEANKSDNFNVSIFLKNENDSVDIKYQNYGSPIYTSATKSNLINQFFIPSGDRLFFSISGKTSVSYILNLQAFTKDNDRNYDPASELFSLSATRQDNASYKFERKELFNNSSNAVYYLFTSPYSATASNDIFTVLSSFISSKSNFDETEGVVFYNTFPRDELFNVKLFVEETNSGRFYLYSTNFDIDTFYKLQRNELRLIKFKSGESSFKFSSNEAINESMYLHFSFDSFDSNPLSGTIRTYKHEENKITPLSDSDINITTNIAGGYYILSILPENLNKKLFYSYELKLTNSDLKKEVAVFLFDQNNSGSLDLTDTYEYPLYFHSCFTSDASNKLISINFTYKYKFNKASINVTASSATGVEFSGDMINTKKYNYSENKPESLLLSNKNAKSDPLNINFKIENDQKDIKFKVKLDFVYEIQKLEFYQNVEITPLTDEIIYLLDTTNTPQIPHISYIKQSSRLVDYTIYATEKTDINSIDYLTDLKNPIETKDFKSGSTFDLSTLGNKKLLIKIKNQSNDENSTITTNHIYQDIDMNSIKNLSANISSPVILQINKDLQNQYNVYANESPLGVVVSDNLSFNVTPTTTISSGSIENLSINQEKVYKMTSLYVYLFPVSESQSTIDIKFQLFNSSKNKFISTISENYISFKYNLNEGESQYIVINPTTLKSKVSFKFLNSGTAKVFKSTNESYQLTSITDITIEEKDLLLVDKSVDLNSGNNILKLEASEATEGEVILYTSTDYNSDHTEVENSFYDKVFAYSLSKVNNQSDLFTDSSISLTIKPQIKVNSLLVIKVLHGTAVVTVGDEADKSEITNSIYKRHFSQIGKYSINISQKDNNDVSFIVYVLAEPNNLIELASKETELTNNVGTVFITVPKKKPESDNHNKRLIFRSDNSKVTFTSFSLIKSELSGNGFFKDLATNNNIFIDRINGVISPVYQINSNTESLYYDYYFKAEDKEYNVIISYSFKESKGDSNPKAYYIDDDLNSEPIKNPSDRKIDFSDSEKQVVMIRDNNTSVTLLRHIKTDKDTYCSFVDPETKELRTLRETTFLSNIINLDIAIFCPRKSKIIFTVNNLPASYTDSSIYLAEKALTFTSNFKANEKNDIVGYLNPQEEFMKNIPEKNIVFYEYIYPKDQDSNEDKVNSILRFIEQPAEEKAHHQADDQRSVTLEGNKFFTAYLFAFDETSNEIALYNPIEIDSKVIPNDRSVRWYIILIIIISCIIALTGIFFIVKHFFFKTNEQEIERGLLMGETNN